MPGAKLMVVFAIVLCTVVIGTAAATIYVAQPGGPSQTTTTSASAISTQSGYSGGLLIRLELNSSKIAPGVIIGINVSDYNPSSADLNLSKSSAWVVAGLSTGGCPSLYLPFGVAVFQGRYTTSNVSQAVPLRIFPLVACPALVRYISGYLFQPMSDNATVLPGTREVSMATGISVSGVYNSTGNRQNEIGPFTPGTYTIVTGDEWGHLVFAYFVVMAS